MDKARTRIGNFHLNRRVYDGDKCEVYEARYAQAGGVVQSAAVKLLKSEFACVGEELRAFLREIDWARGLRHPLFPRVMEAGEHEGLYFLAMERLEGSTLEELLRNLAVLQVKLPIQVGLTLAHQIADGMQAMHEQCEGDTHLGVVHLGIDPSNIVVRKAGTAALFDFGETMAAGVGDAALPADRGAAYQAPERQRMLPVDCRADIYSLGRVLESMSNCMDPSELGADLPALIARACSTHAEERFQSMRELMDAIELVADNRRTEFSCHACSKFVSEVFGGAQLRTDPRAHRPRAASAPLRMASEGLATVASPVLGPPDRQRVEHDTAPGAWSPDPGATLDPSAALRRAATVDPGATLDPSAALQRAATVDPGATLDPSAGLDPGATVVGGAFAEGSTGGDRDPMLVEDTERTDSPKKPFVDEHLAVTRMSAPRTMEALAASEESTAVSAAHIDAASGRAEGPGRKAWPEELVATKAYSPDPETDEELAVAIERLRR